MGAPKGFSPANEWPVIADINAVESDNAKALIERADALLKAQDDGLKAMEARMSSLFGQSVTLASAAVAATVTAFAAIETPTGASPLPMWAFPWVAKSLVALSACWLAAVTASAASMLGQAWTASGMKPADLYREDILTAPPNSLRLAIARALQDAVKANEVRTARYSRRLALVIGLLASGPLTTATVALLLARPPWTPWVGAGLFVAAHLWLMWLFYRQSKN